MTDNNGPTQTAYDRLQRAGTRSPMVIGDTRVVYELCAQGIRIVGSRPGYARHHIVTWHELALCNIDPIMFHHEKVLGDLQNREKLRAAG